MANRPAVNRFWLLLVAALAGLAGPVSTKAAGAQTGCPQAIRTSPSERPPVAVQPSRVGGCDGYWIASTDGGVFSFGAAPYFGAAQGMSLASPIVGMVATPDGGGYWLVGSDGGVFAFGDARYLGSTGGIRLNEPIVGMAATPDGGGYWLVGSDGGVFAFGDARYLGSTGGIRLNEPIVGMAATSDGGGYWLVGSDGGVFAFGGAPFDGSMGAVRLQKPVVAIAEDPTTGGYWLVGADGAVFSFNAPFYGSMGGTTLHRPVIAAAAVDGGGYDLLGADGGVFSFGQARFFGTAPGPAVAGTVIAVDPGHNGGNGSAPGTIGQPIWNGRSAEACDTAGAETTSGYPEHAFNWAVAQDLAGDLEADGARVIMTRNSDAGVGPCVDERARIGNEAGADAAVSIHADGGPPGGRGFTVLEPVADGINNAVIAPSSALAVAVPDAFVAGAGEPVSDYYGADGIEARDDLGGLNLSTVPKVLIECANMSNAADAALILEASWQHQAATAIATGLNNFMAGR
ncbi:MAG TPA: N-acetylmuramoyl-L-alanine amidase [Acidimicrobiales bacterium]|nr:N-acetylmuramoyl-L-alanine amidase [Acidimicrobiales bacterium]